MTEEVNSSSAIAKGPCATSLLAEYAAAQQACDASSSRCWSIMGLSSAFVVAGPIALGTLIRFDDTGLHYTIIRSLAAITFLLSFAAIVLIWCGFFMVKRERRYLKVYYARMREIEQTLQLARNWYIMCLDASSEEWTPPSHIDVKVVATVVKGATERFGNPSIGQCILVATVVGTVLWAVILAASLLLFGDPSILTRVP